VTGLALSGLIALALLLVLIINIAAILYVASIGVRNEKAGRDDSPQAALARRLTVAATVVLALLVATLVMLVVQLVAVASWV